ncbi:hypothetical protein, partial [Anoxybacillus sp. EFIL]|uniref:hypothetical protein n=1 Tax=Anoxybacillus sp. EFIL TaxID=2508869 RepID=UPI00148DD0CE
GGSGCQGAMITQYSHDLGWKGIQIDAGTQIVLENIYLAPMNPQVSRKEPITNGSCFGIQVNTGGFVTIDNVNMLRCDGIGIHITIGAYGFWGSHINIFQTAYKGVFIDNPQGNYVYRIKLENVNVDCLYSTTIPYDFDMLAMS